ncbi:MAG: hypothetical protein N4Q32_03540, partial [Neisseriaceae bacterium]|nr:hypothetical protein [Neisseriaceae bacterium]
MGNELIESGTNEENTGPPKIAADTVKKLPDDKRGGETAEEEGPTKDNPGDITEEGILPDKRGTEAKALINPKIEDKGPINPGINAKEASGINNSDKPGPIQADCVDQPSHNM